MAVRLGSDTSKLYLVDQTIRLAALGFRSPRVNYVVHFFKRVGMPKPARGIRGYPLMERSLDCVKGPSDREPAPLPAEPMVLLSPQVMLRSLVPQKLLPPVFPTVSS